MGTFHTIGVFNSILGKRFQDAGLRDLCIEAGIIAEGSVSAVMEGEQHNMAVRTHKIVYEGHSFDKNTQIYLNTSKMMAFQQRLVKRIYLGEFP